MRFVERVTLGGPAHGEFPFAQVDFTVAVEIEALEQARAVALPVGQQFADLPGGVGGGADAADGGEFADGVDRIVLDQGPTGWCAGRERFGKRPRVTSISAPSGSTAQCPDPSSSRKDDSLS